MEPWKFADRISDEIVSLANKAIKDPDFDPLELLAGFLLALFALLQTTEGLRPPPEIDRLKASAELCLHAIKDAKEKNNP